MIRSILVVFAGMIAGIPTAHAARPAETGSPARKAPSGLAARIWEITDLVLDNHVDPPTRQEMIIVAIKRMHGAATVANPNGLARRVSALSSLEELGRLLDEIWSWLPSDRMKIGNDEMKADELLIGLLLGALPYGGNLISAKELKVQEQFAGNRYVGLQIALGVDQESKRVSIATVLQGGPADRAGVKDHDLIEEIDGTSTEGLPMQKVVDRLRGAEGSQVVIRVRQPKADESRVITVTRGVLPRSTVKGIRDRSEGVTDVLIHSSEPIGYLKFQEILGSTPHELRKLALQLEEEGAKALVLDLRSVVQAHLHPTVLLADGLLDGGTIGRMRTARGVETFRAEPDSLFPGWPLAVLVADDTPPIAQWLAAALQDNHRAIVVGMADPRNTGPGGLRRGPGFRGPAAAYVASAVPVGDGSSSIQMATGRLERGDGRPFEGIHGNAESHLEPDLVVGATPPPQQRAPRPMTLPGLSENITVGPAPAKPKASPRSGGDIVLDAAVQRLRELLKEPAAPAPRPDSP